MKEHWAYIKFLIRHKWFVFLACRREGLIWQGIIHDFTKFLPCEYFPYKEYFYGNNGGSWRGVYTRESSDISLAFKVAWNHHQKHNKHHHQYWVLKNDSGSEEALGMPYRDMIEMICDWKAAGMAIKGHGWEAADEETWAWYLKNQDKMLLHIVTRVMVEYELKRRLSR